MASSAVASLPRYTFEATRRSGLGLGRPVRLELYDDSIRIYRRKSHILREGEYTLLRRARYSDIRRCEFIGRRVESSRLTLAGFAWAEMPAQVELLVSGTPSGQPEGFSSWNHDLLRFNGGNLDEGSFEGMYLWLRKKLELQTPGPSRPSR